VCGLVHARPHESTSQIVSPTVSKITHSRIYFHTPARACRVCEIAHAPTALADFLSRVTKKIMISYSSIRDRVVDTAVTVVMWSCVMGLLYITVVLRERRHEKET